MGLKRKLDSLDGVDMGLRAFYKPAGDNEEGFLLDVDDWPDVGGLQRTVRVLRKTEDEYKGFRKALGNRDAEELKTILSEYETLKQQVALLDDPAKVKDELAKLTADMKKNYEGMIDGLNTKLRETESMLVATQGEVKRGIIMRGLEQQARTANVLPEYLDDIYLRAGQFDEIDGQLVVINDQGEPLRSKKDATQLKPASEWFDEMAKMKPGWFKGSESGGAKGGAGSRVMTIPREDSEAIAANLKGIIDGTIRVT
jgi:hypothetical protein